ncbi:cytochrome b [Oleiagrimonas citrea]|jgi:cytochrome b561|uniref:Cytochrome b n=1 Tax=Oleiagrimonas citrea TaxID=1665687 RepID=A0A846ZJ47_9GAMM|nr:cytochrome b [Oleiagrimonas citrea]NKZ38224.1 cytochrome b [Oleiagrimonas citrea]
MPLRNESDRWGAVPQLFHWLIVLLILGQGVLGLVMVELPKRPSVFAVYNLHKSIGLTILALAVLRLLWRVFDRRPKPVPMPRWQHLGAEIMHWALYVLLFAVPLSGWLFDSATGLRPLFWWGVLRMPSLTGGAAPHLRELFEELHEVLFWALIALAALHAAAAIKHHLIDRDDTLRRMLPGFGGKSRRRASRSSSA